MSGVPRGLQACSYDSQKVAMTVMLVAGALISAALAAGTPAATRPWQIAFRPGFVGQNALEVGFDEAVAGQEIVDVAVRRSGISKSSEYRWRKNQMSLRLVQAEEGPRGCPISRS